MPARADRKRAHWGIRALGLGHVIAGAANGRDLAYYGADVLNIWSPTIRILRPLPGTCRSGCVSTLLHGSKEDRADFDCLLKNADVFLLESAPGYFGRDMPHRRRAQPKQSRD